MRLPLKIHSHSRCEAVTRIEVEVRRPRPSELELHYFATGDPGALRIPPATIATREDELWRHTCFEAFLRAPTRTPYYEFNFSPSTQWAAYRFDGYRSGMRAALEMDAPRVTQRLADSCYELKVSLELDRMTLLHESASWLLGLSAVIEERSGRISYWALAHPPDKPDFHHADGFAFEIPAERP